MRRLLYRQFRYGIDPDASPCSSNRPFWLGWQPILLLSLLVHESVNAWPSILKRLHAGERCVSTPTAGNGKRWQSFMSAFSHGGVSSECVALYQLGVTGERPAGACRWS